MDSRLGDFKEVILFFQNPADPKVQFDASTSKELGYVLYKTLKIYDC